MTAVQRDQLQRARLDAEKRLNTALVAEGRARLVAETQATRISYLDGLLTQGQGHLFTPMPDLTPSVLLKRAGPPMCRRCRVPAVEVNAQAPCPGDQHRCPKTLAAAEHPDARDLGDGRWQCGQAGEMTSDGRLWTCYGGHVTARDGHVPVWRNHAGVCVSADTDCPWDYLDAGQR